MLGPGWITGAGIGAVSMPRLDMSAAAAGRAQRAAQKSPERTTDRRFALAALYQRIGAPSQHMKDSHPI